MRVVLIHEDNHGMIGVALNYFHAVNWLINEQWLVDNTEVYDDKTDSWNRLDEELGEDWADLLTDYWDIDNFNAYFSGSFYLESVEVYGSEMD